ncbi:MAG TPA: hypothetical protein VGP43_06970 [Chitinophagaceae bacterium]|nr:hypothetical protein [Chitinophagaceae bacterium]
MKKINLICILFYISFIGCQKEISNNVSNDCSNITTEKIIGRYKLTVLEEKLANGSIKNYLAQLPACELDDIYNFSNNGTFISEPNTLKCTSTDNNVQGTWLLDYDNSSKEYYIVVKISTSTYDWGPITCVDKSTITTYNEFTNPNGIKLYEKRVWTRL